MSDLIHIFGHKNPDTDSICSAIAYAHLKRTLGENAQAFRLGDINFETSFILDKYKVQAPELLEDGRSRLIEIEIDKPLVVNEDLTVYEALKKMKTTKNKAIYIANEDGLQGIATLSDITQTQVQDHKRLRTLMSATSLDNICKVLDAKVIYEATDYQTNGKVYIAALSIAQLERFDFNEAITIVGDNHDNQLQVILKGSKLMIVSAHSEVSPTIIKIAQDYGCTIISTQLDTFNIARFIYQAPTVKSIMTTNITTFNQDDYVDDVIRAITHTRYRSYPVLDQYRNVVGAISRYHLFNYAKRKVILLDHNEKSQSIDNIDQVNILEIIDHHRIGDIQTSYPINFRNQLVGSTATIISMAYREQAIEIPYNIACLLLSAIISDTLNFNSPTCTTIDIMIANEIADKNGLDLKQMANDLFMATSSLKNKDVQQIVYNDFKEYTVNNKKVAIGQVNIVDKHELIERYSEISHYLEELIHLNNYDILLLVFSDVNLNGSYFIYKGKLSMAVEKAFPGAHEGLDKFHEGIISRKKQLVPRLFHEI